MASKLNNKEIYFLIFLLISNSILAQDQKENKFNSYSDVKNSINGKTILINRVGFVYDKMINLLQKEGINAISSEPEIILNNPWDVYNGSDTDTKNIITKNSIQTILLIRINEDLSNIKTNQNIIFEDYEGPIKANIQYSKISKNVEILFQIYKHKNDYEKTVIVINLKSDSKKFLGVSTKNCGSKIMDKKSKAVFQILKIILKKMKKNQDFE